ncbi:MAG: PIN domain-containing protein [Chloroflexota bacterium]|nr:MAG: PIN domain-containing protein [Chloroflexota bacterium]
MTHLLDSSAWLAHLFGEPGVDQVTILFDDSATRICISALSIPEVFGRLNSIGRQDHWPEVWAIYEDLFASVIAADAKIAHQAVHLRNSTAERLPTIDGLIAATAFVHRFTLVHRDPHMSSIAEPDLSQIRLPDR